jgi:hypothetical protein
MDVLHHVEKALRCTAEGHSASGEGFKHKKELARLPVLALNPVASRGVGCDKVPTSAADNGMIGSRTSPIDDGTAANVPPELPAGDKVKTKTDATLYADTVRQLYANRDEFMRTFSTINLVWSRRADSRPAPEAMGSKDLSSRFLLCCPNTVFGCPYITQFVDQVRKHLGSCKFTRRGGSLVLLADANTGPPKRRH